MTDIEQRLEEAADALNAAAASAHERADCPTCGRRAGDRCMKIGSHRTYPKILKHSHQARLQAAGIPLR